MSSYENSQMINYFLRSFHREEKSRKRKLSIIVINAFCAKKMFPKCHLLIQKSGLNIKRISSISPLQQWSGRHWSGVCIFLRHSRNDNDLSIVLKRRSFPNLRASAPVTSLAMKCIFGGSADMSCQRPRAHFFPASAVVSILTPLHVEKNFWVSSSCWFYQVASEWVSVRNLEPRSRYYRIRNNSVHGLVAHCWVKRDSAEEAARVSERALERRLGGAQVVLKKA